MSNTLRRLVASGATVVLATVGVQVLATGSAFAHAVAVTGSAACQSDGTYTVTWTIANDYQLIETSVVTAHSPSGSTVSPSSVSTVAYGSATISQTGVAGSATSASLTVSSVWSDGYSRHNHGSVELAGACLPGHTPAAPTWSDGSCSARAAVLPSITIPSDTGVTYRIVHYGAKTAGTYPEPAGTYTVTARSTTYTLTGTTSWTFQLAAGPTDCNEAVVPISPVLTQSSCAQGSPSAPSLVQLGNDGVAYTVSADGPYSGGQAVTVTATAQTGYEFTTVPTGWIRVNSTTATYLVAFAATPTCVAPQSPVIVQASCAAATSPGLSLPTTSGVSYAASSNGPYSGGQAVTVTATAQPGNEFSAPAPNGWTFVDASTETYQLTFAAAPNCAAATAPSFVDDTCAAFAATGASYTIPTVTGVEYYLGATPVTAGTHPATDGTTATVTAQPQPGYTLTGETSWTHTFAATPTCSGIEGVTVTRPPHQVVAASGQQPTTLTPAAGLASTGAPVGELLLVGAALLLLGVGCIAMATGRRRSQG